MKAKPDLLAIANSLKTQHHNENCIWTGERGWDCRFGCKPVPHNHVRDLYREARKRLTLWQKIRLWAEGWARK